MQIKSDETEDEETIASSSCLPTTQTYGSDQVAALAVLKRALQHAFKLVSKPCQDSYSFKMKVLANPCQVNLPTCAGQSSAMSRIHHVQIVCIQTVTRILLHVYVCLEVKDFICSSDCIMHNMSFGKSGVGDSYTCHFV